MSTSKTVTRTDLTSILNDVLPAIASPVQDMTNTEINEFVSNLTPTTSENISAAIADYFTPTPWTNLTLNSKVSAAGTAPINAWRMIGPFVELRICFTVSGTATSYTEVSSMPAGKRPAQTVKIPCQGNASTIMVCEVNAAGAINIYCPTSTSAWFAGTVLYYPEY